MSQVAHDCGMTNVKVGDIYHLPLIEKSSHLSIEESQSNIIYLWYVYALFISGTSMLSVPNHLPLYAPKSNLS